jgi:chromosome segregation ATPase
MSEHQPNPASAAGDDDLEQMTPNQRRALNKALAALETMAALWASEIRLTDLSKRIADVPDAAERAKRIAAFVEQGFIEGAYRHYLDHKDQIEALATDRAQATGLVDQHHRDSAELRKLCEARDQARRTAEYWKAEHNAVNKRIAALEAQIATVAPAVDAQPVGVAGTMPGTDGFTMAAFKASEVPVGTPLYASAQSEGLRKE